MTSGSIWIVIIGIIVILILIIILVMVIVAPQRPCVLNKNFERQFLQKLHDPDFLELLNQSPKFILETEISQYLGQEFRFSDNVNVKVLQEDPDDLYIMIPTSDTFNTRILTPLEQVVNALNEKETYGLFMGEFEDIWWRLGVHRGGCITDIKNEIERIKRRRCLICR